MNDNDDDDNDSMSSISSTRMSSSSSSSSSSDEYYDDDDDDFSMVRSHIFGPALPPPPDHHRTLNRGTRKVYDHLRAFACIERDYLGNSRLIPLLDSTEFAAMFRISKARFQRLRRVIGSLGDPFYVHLPRGANGMIGASLDARLLLPLKSLAFGVPSHAFREYFQMSKTLARDCCRNFNKVIKENNIDINDDRQSIRSR